MKTWMKVALGVFALLVVIALATSPGEEEDSSSVTDDPVVTIEQVEPEPVVTSIEDLSLSDFDRWFSDSFSDVMSYQSWVSTTLESIIEPAEAGETDLMISACGSARDDLISYFGEESNTPIISILREAPDEEFSTSAMEAVGHFLIGLSGCAAGDFQIAEEGFTLSAESSRVATARLNFLTP